ncbi:MAG: mechanosensitive ion channel family protein [Propionibacteriaceae bacterium]|nr:mechanosensitive ion channel family protein [Propionibacteriaceae bacterium]
MVVATIGIAIVLHVIVVQLIKRVTRRVSKMASQPEGSLAHNVASALGSASGAKPGRTVVHMTALAHLLKSVWTIVLVIVVILTVLSTLGVPLSPILASAGIGGIVLAFGAQSLIKDYLSGISMILEDQYGVGDQIDVGEVTGTVDAITLRITKIHDQSGTIWYIRNGQIMRVGNISQGYSTGLIDVPVSYDADVTVVTEVLTKVVEEVSQDPTITEKLIKPPQLLGVESITPTTMTMRILIKTAPNQQHGPSRDIRERAMAALAAAGIPSPMTQL